MKLLKNLMKNKVVVFVLIIIGMWLALTVVFHLPNMLSKRENYVNSGNRFVLFYASWCGHCKRLKEGAGNAWDQIQQFGSNVSYVEEDCSNGNTELAKQHNVSGYPTLILFKADGSTVKYSSRRDYNTMKSFLENNGIN